MSIRHVNQTYQSEIFVVEKCFPYRSPRDLVDIYSTSIRHLFDISSVYSIVALL